mmetsp:Transcript_40031/g.66420  ORF Transcript_40031/g.66420 Transcript_40031/m.66420 type:complete len:100 (-) Transcript_40031:404-703(-)
MCPLPCTEAPGAEKYHPENLLARTNDVDEESSHKDVEPSNKTSGKRDEGKSPDSVLEEGKCEDGHAEINEDESFGNHCDAFKRVASELNASTREVFTGV